MAGRKIGGFWVSVCRKRNNAINIKNNILKSNIFIYIYMTEYADIRIYIKSDRETERERGRE